MQRSTCGMFPGAPPESGEGKNELELAANGSGSQQGIRMVESCLAYSMQIPIQQPCIQEVRTQMTCPMHMLKVIRITSMGHYKQ